MARVNIVKCDLGIVGINKDSRLGVVFTAAKDGDDE